MGVVHFKEVTGRSGSEDQGTNREYVRTFQVLTESPSDGADIVRDYGEVPSRGETYNYVDALGGERADETSVCVSVRVSQDDGDNFQNWTVVAEYRGLDDPTADPPEVDYETVSYQAAKLKDTLGTVYRNSAGDPPEGGRLVDADRFTLTIVKNVTAAAWNPLVAELYLNSLNSQVFLAARHPPGFAAGTCKLKLTARLVWYPDRTTFYWRRTAKIEYKREGWVGKLRDAGYNAKIAGGMFGGVPVPMIASNGTRYTHPQLLDGSGYKLAPGGTPVEISYADYNTQAWGVLDLEY